MAFAGQSVHIKISSESAKNNYMVEQCDFAVSALLSGLTLIRGYQGPHISSASVGCSFRGFRENLIALEGSLMVRDGTRQRSGTSGGKPWHWEEQMIGGIPFSMTG